MKQIYLFILAAFLACQSTNAQAQDGNTDYYEEPKFLNLTQEEQACANACNDFTFRLFRASKEEENIVLSPLSVTYALSMLNNGASGETREEIKRALGFGDKEVADINAFCLKMMTDCATLDNRVKLLISNTVFMNKGYMLKPSFVETVKHFYDATPETRDFHDGLTMDAINQWASDHTEGMIPKVLDKNSFDPDAVSYLMNAIYFCGTWQDPFDKSWTVTEPFGKNGELIPMMHKYFNFTTYKETDDFQMLSLPYGMGTYRLLVFLPKEGRTIDNVLDALAANWPKAASYTEYNINYVVDVKLPAFETSTSLRLNDIMTSLGVERAFNPMLAEFPDFCNTPTYISAMLQDAKIEVNEEGTKAAAVTTIIATTGVQKERHAQFYANRPFLYAIVENNTNTIFFIGQYMGNTPADVTNPKLATSAPTTTYDLQGRRLTAEPQSGVFIRDGKKIMK